MSRMTWAVQPCAVCSNLNWCRVTALTSARWWWRAGSSFSPWASPERDHWPSAWAIRTSRTRRSKCCVRFFAGFQAGKDGHLLGREVLADKYQFRALSGKRFEVPTSADKVEKLRALGKSNEAFGSINLRGQAGGELFEFVPIESVGG